MILDRQGVGVIINGGLVNFADMNKLRGRGWNWTRDMGHSKLRNVNPGREYQEYQETDWWGSLNFRGNWLFHECLYIWDTKIPGPGRKKFEILVNVLSRLFWTQEYYIWLKDYMRYEISFNLIWDYIISMLGKDS